MSLPSDLLLCLDTATPAASVALTSPQTGLCLSHTEAKGSHGPRVLVIVRDLLEQAGLPVTALSAVACGRGPGSFTGLRIGLASAKGLCFALDVPLLLPSSLEAVARSAPHTPSTLVVGALDARRQELFFGAWLASDNPSQPLEAVLPAAAGSPDELARRVLAVDHTGPILVTGSGAALYQDRLAAALGEQARVDPDAPQTPDAVVLAAMAREMLARGEVADLDSAEPEYLRPSDAELNRDRRQATAKQDTK